MKKIHLLLIIALSVMLNITLIICLWQTPPSQSMVDTPAVDVPAEEILLAEEERHPLDIEYEEALNNPGLRSDRDIHREYIDKWSEEMERYLELMQSEFDEQLWEVIADSQNKWEDFTESDWDFRLQLSILFHGRGSILADFDAARRYHKYRDRALYLKERYEQFITATSTTFEG